LSRIRFTVEKVEIPGGRKVTSRDERDCHIRDICTLCVQMIALALAGNVSRTVAVTVFMHEKKKRSLTAAV